MVLTLLLKVGSRNNILYQKQLLLNQSPLKVMTKHEKLFLSRTARPKSSLPISSSTNLNEITEQPASKAKSIPNFNDAVSAHGNKSIVELIRSILVFQLCKFPFLVNNANQLLNYSNRILG